MGYFEATNETRKEAALRRSLRAAAFALEARGGRTLGDPGELEAGLLAAAAARGAADKAATDKKRAALVGLTDLPHGFLRGWSRIFKRQGFFVTIDPRSQNPDGPSPVGPQPTLEEWATFDAQANAAGVGGYVAQLRKNATPSTAFLPSLSRALSSLGHGVASGRLDVAVKAGDQALLIASDEIDRFVPGAGPIIMDGLIAALFPLIPVLPGLLSQVAAAAGTLPGAGGLVQSLVETGIQGTVAPSSGAFTAAAPTVEASVGQGVAGTLISTVRGGVADLAPFRASLLKARDIIQNTQGGLLAKLEAVGLEAEQEFAFALALCVVVAPASIALSALSLASAALKTAYTLSHALEAAAALKKAAAAARAAALAEEAALDAEIASLLAEIARVKAETLAFAAKRGAKGSAAPAAKGPGLGLLLLGGAAAAVLA